MVMGNEVLTENNTMKSIGDRLSVKRANLFYLIELILSVVIGAIPGITNVVPATIVPLFSYIPVVVLAIIFCKKEGVSFSNSFGFKGAKPLSFLLVFIICIAFQPTIYTVSTIANRIYPNIVSQASGSASVVNDSMFINFIGIAIIPPFFEEFVIRGGLLGSYVKTGRLRAAAILTGLIFGLSHMNGAQFFHTAIMGVLLAVIFEITDSIWPGIMFHFINNGQTLLVPLLYGKIDIDKFKKVVYPYERGFKSVTDTLITIGFVIAGLVITVLCLKYVAKCEGTEDRLWKDVETEAENKKLITPALIIALVFLILMTLFMTIALIIALKKTGA